MISVSNHQAGSYSSCASTVSARPSQKNLYGHWEKLRNLQLIGHLDPGPFQRSVGFSASKVTNMPNDETPFCVFCLCRCTCKQVYCPMILDHDFALTRKSFDKCCWFLRLSATFRCRPVIFNKRDTRLPQKCCTKTVEDV